MGFQWWAKIKKFSVSLRFSILAIFITLFVISMLSLITLMYVQFKKTAVYVSFRLMNEACCRAAFSQVSNQLQDTAMKSQSAGSLLQAGVVNTENPNELFTYLKNIIEFEANIFPALQSVYWGDSVGNFMMVMKQNDGGMLGRMNTLASKSATVATYDKNGKTVKTDFVSNFIYDPRNTPWYIAASQAKKTTWVPVYHYRLSGFLGASVATPVYATEGSLKGVINFDLRLDDLRKIIEKIPIGKTGTLFIVNNENKLVAFPHLVQYDQQELADISSLNTTFPYVVRAYQYYKESMDRTFIFSINNKRYLAAFRALPAFGVHQWYIGAVAPEADFTKVINKINIITMIWGFIILVICIFVVSALISRAVKSLSKITQEIRRIESFQLDETPTIQSRIIEVSYIATALQSMKQGLRSFQKYVPSVLVRQLIKMGTAAEISGEKKTLTVMFSDIKDFTSIAEKTHPDDLVPHICDYFDAISQIIVSNRGTIDKYIGDAIMAIWGAPLPESQPCHQAALTAIESVQRLNQLNAKWLAEGKSVFFTRFGIHAGEAIVGNLGSSERLNYTAIGDTVNIASRLEGINKLYGTQIIVSDVVYSIIKDQFLLRLLDHVTLKGKEYPSFIYELCAMDKNQLSYDLTKYNILFEQGFNAYKQQKWDKAIDYFSQCLHIYPEDHVAVVFIERCQNFKNNPPETNWDGVWHLHDK